MKHIQNSHVSNIKSLLFFSSAYHPGPNNISSWLYSCSNLTCFNGSTFAHLLQPLSNKIPRIMPHQHVKCSHSST